MSKYFRILSGGFSAYFGLKDKLVLYFKRIENYIKIDFQYRIIPSILREITSGDSHTED